MSLAQFFEFNEANFVNGQARLLYSPLLGEASPNADVAVPSGPAAIFGQVSPYSPVAPTGYQPWVDIGGTSSAPVYSRSLATTEWKVQQQLAAVLRVPNEVERTVKIPACEFARADLLAMFENATVTGAISAGTGTGAFTSTSFGQFTSLLQYRLALAGFMPLEAGNVYEGSSSGPVRPRLVVQAFYRCSISPENVSVNWQLGEMVNADLTFNLYPEPGQPQNAEYGAYWIETAGTVA
jgi:hypothetical protein